MIMMKRLGFDQVSVDSDVKMVETKDEIVFKGVVIAREIVQPYDIDGKRMKAYKPADELKDCAWTAEGRWIRIDEHPTTAMIARREDIHGRMQNVTFVKNLMDAKTGRPMARGVKADLHFFKRMISEDKQDEIRDLKNRDVSIGFMYDFDETPGKWNGDSYDFIQRGIFIDHLAGPIPYGRCTMPYCGIGADQIIAKIVGHDPFGEYESFEDCVNKNQDKDDPEAYCATIKREIEGETDSFMEKVKSLLRLSKGDKNMKNIKRLVLAERAKTIAKDQSLEEIEVQITDLKQKRDILQEQLNGFSEVTEEEQERWLERERLWVAISDIEDELRAYQQAKVNVISEQVVVAIVSEGDQEDYTKFIAGCVASGKDIEACVEEWNLAHTGENQEADNACIDECTARKKAEYLAKGFAEDDVPYVQIDEECIVECAEQDPEGHQADTYEECVEKCLEEGGSQEECAEKCGEDAISEYQECFDQCLVDNEGNDFAIETCTEKCKDKASKPETEGDCRICSILKELGKDRTLALILRSYSGDKNKAFIATLKKQLKDEEHSCPEDQHWDPETEECVPDEEEEEPSADQLANDTRRLLDRPGLYNNTV